MNSDMTAQLVETMKNRDPDDEMTSPGLKPNFRLVPGRIASDEAVVPLLSRVKRGELKLTEAAELLEVSYRHAKRLKKRYRAGGAKTLVHGNVGRASNRADQKRRQQVLELVRENYAGEGHERFGPTLASEHRSRPRPGSAARNTAALDARRGSVEPPSHANRIAPGANAKRTAAGSHHHWLENAARACLSSTRPVWRCADSTRKRPGPARIVNTAFPRRCTARKNVYQRR